MQFLFPAWTCRFARIRRKEQNFFVKLFLNASLKIGGFEALFPPIGRGGMVSGVFPASRKSARPAQTRLHRPPAQFEGSAARWARPRSVMSIEAASAVRATDADYREASRHLAHQRAAERADVRRDQRIEEAKASDAVRSRPSDRAADLPEPRPRSSPKALLLDVLA
jgi:hypothetical protein